MRSIFRRSLEDTRYPLTAQRIIDLFGGPKVHAGVTVSTTSAMGLTAVWSAVNLIAGTIASLPMKGFRERSGGRNEVDFKLAVEPYPDLTAYEWVENLVASLLTNGNSYHLKIRNETGTDILRLMPIPPTSVTVKKERSSSLNPSGKLYKVAGVPVEYTPYEVMHIPGLSLDGLVGLSPIAVERQALGLSLAQEEFAARFFGSGSLLGGVLETDQALPDEAAAEALKKRWRDKVAGIAHAHEVAVLDRGAKFTRVGVPPQEAQFIEGRGFQLQEVARIFRVPNHLLMDGSATSNWGTGVQEHGTQFVRFCLRPWMSRIEQKMSAHLLPRGTYCEFDATALLRGSAAERAAYYQSMKTMGALTVDEIRDFEGLEPLAETPLPLPEPEPDDEDQTDEETEEEEAEVPA